MKKYTLNIHNFYENSRNKKSQKNHGGMLTQLLLSHLLLALTIYQINAIRLVFYSMVRYAGYLTLRR